MHTFITTIEIIGVNPYVSLSPVLLKSLMKRSWENKRFHSRSPPYQQHFVHPNTGEVRREWRLYLNMPMRKTAGKDVGDRITIAIEYDAVKRAVPLHPKLAQALANNNTAKQKFDGLLHSRQKEIIRYISHLKSEEAVAKNVKRAIIFLLEKERFIGREKP